MTHAARLGFHASLAIADTLRVLAPQADIALKWPNDVLLNGGKVSGILLESLHRPKPDDPALALGIGVNLADAPPPDQTRWPATSVRHETESVPSVDRALTLLARRLDHWLSTEQSSGFAAVLSAWKARVIRIGSEIEVRLPNESLTGVFKDVDADGVLVLETANGTRRITAGDVFFPEPS